MVVARTLERMLMRKLLWLAAAVVLASCGRNGSLRLSWPATIGGLEGFSDTQRTAVMSAIAQLNVKIKRTMISPAGLPASRESSEGSPIYFRFADNIPEQKKVIAGRATVDGEKCVVQISSVVADNNELLVPVIWHELGHCAGLDHDPKAGEVMYASTVSMKNYDEATLSRFFSHVLEASGLSSAP